MIKTTPIAEVMTRAPQVIVSDATINQVIKIFDEHRFHHLPVVDSDGLLVGIVSKTDVALYHRVLSDETTGHTYSNIVTTYKKVEDIMTKPPIQLRPEDSVEMAAELFSKNLFHAIPVTQQGRLVGIVTTHDLICYAFEKTPD